MSYLTLLKKKIINHIKRYRFGKSRVHQKILQGKNWSIANAKNVLNIKIQGSHKKISTGFPDFTGFFQA